MVDPSLITEIDKARKLIEREIKRLWIPTNTSNFGEPDEKSTHIRTTWGFLNNQLQKIIDGILIGNVSHQEVEEVLNRVDYWATHVLFIHPFTFQITKIYKLDSSREFFESGMLSTREFNRTPNILERLISPERFELIGGSKPNQNLDEKPVGFVITEEPLTLKNLTNAFMAINSLYTKCWLISHQRFDDLALYGESHTELFEWEAGLLIEKITYASPANIRLITDSRLGLVLNAIFDAVAQTPIRVKEGMLNNEEKETKIKQQDRQADLDLKKQEKLNDIEIQKAELEKERLKLNIEKERLEVEKLRYKTAIQISIMTIDRLQPDADNQVKSMLARSLVSDILQLSNTKNFEIDRK